MAKTKRKSKKSNIRNLITKVSPKSTVAEQYRTLRTNIQFSSVDNELATILITSAGPDEGKTSTISNLAVVYAQHGKKVLLVDADLRKPTIHHTFHVDNITGLSNVLVGSENLADAITNSEVEGLDLVTSGPIPPNPSELLGSQRMEQFIVDARKEYDLILFDTPPILAVTDSQLLANYCDGALLVVRSKRTEYDPAKKAIEALEPAKAKFLGTVLNDQDKKDANYYYY